MKTSKSSRLRHSLALAALVVAWIVAPLNLRAETWIGGLLGDWNVAANWNNGTVPNANIGEVINGTALISNSVPSVTEAWAGNSGIAGTVIVTNGGTLPVSGWLVVGRTGAGGNTPLSTLIVSGDGVINKSGSGFIVGDSTFCLGQVIVKDNAQVNVTGGWNGIGNGNGGEGWFTLQDNAVFNTIGQDWNIGDWGSGRGHAYIKDNATLNVSRFWVGKGENEFGATFGALWQSGGAIVGAAGGNEWCVGGQDAAHLNSFGYIDLSGGTFSTPNNFQIGRNGKGVIYQTGGSLTASGWTALGRFGTGLGVVWVSGGSFSHTGSPQQFFVAENGRGEFTLSGTGILDCNLKLRMGNSGGTGFVNFNGGTARLPGIEQTGGSGYVNFNGGTVQAKISTTTFMQGLMEARLLAGHAIFDTDGNDITIAQALLDGAGQGVLNIPITDGGAGYQAPPIVQIFGDGFGALAVAQIDPAAGTVTNIIVTAPGYAYSSASAVLVGGVPTTEAVLDAAVIGPVAGGGVIKNGAGTLTLTGPNNYTGPTVVNAGQLNITTDPTGAGSYTVADGAGLGLDVLFDDAFVTVASLTLGGTTGASLDFDLGAFGNPFSAPLVVSGALTVNGVTTVNIADALPQLGQFPLIQYASRSGSGSFVIGSLPIGVTATIVTNAGGSIDLNITAVAAPRWEGQVNGTWDIGTTANWIELSTGLAAFYQEGNAVTFDDQALGTTDVSLGITINPAKVTVNNSVLNYTLSGGGKISGAATLTKQGTGSLALHTVNDYTGVTRLAGGTVSVTNLANGGQPSAIGSATADASNLVLAGGTLSYSGPAAAIDRGYSVQGTNAGLETLSDLTLSGPVTAGLDSSFQKAGPARLAYTGAGVRELSGGANPGYNVLDGTVLFDGTGGGQTNHSQREFWVGTAMDTGAHLILSNTVLNVDSWLAVGRGNGTVGNVSTAALYDSRLRSGSFSMGYDNGLFGNLGHSILTLNGTSTFTNNGDLNMGESGGSLSEIFLNGNSHLYSGGRAHIGWHNNATGAVTLAQSAGMTVNAWFSVGHEGGVGTFTMKDNSSLWILWDLNITDVGLGDGTLVMQDNSRASAGAVFIAKGNGSTGTASLTGNPQIDCNNMFVGNGAASIATVTQTGGTIIGRTTGTEMHIGFHGTATWNMSGGSILAPNHWFIVGRWADGPGELNVTDGTIIHGTNNAGRLFRVGEDGLGVLNLSGNGAVATSCNEVTIGWNASGNGTLNLNGGSFQARRIIGGAGLSTINFNGGVLRAGPNANVNFLTALTTANVLAGGAVIDTADQNIGIAQALLDGGGNGGLIKQGTGALYLNGANTYIGPTLIAEGTLGGSGFIAGSVTIAADATLAPGTSIGNLTVGTDLILGGNTVMEVSKDGDVLASDLATATGNLAFGGTLTVVVTGTNALAVGDTFNLFDWGTRSGSFAATDLPADYSWDLSQLAVDGTISVTAVLSVPTVNPPVFADGNLILTGTGGAPGASYTWLTSTNVAAPVAEWTTNTAGTFDGSGAFSNGLPVNPSEAARFFRLRQP